MMSKRIGLAGIVIVLCLSLLANATGLYAQAPPEFPPNVAAEIQAALDTAISESGLPGAVLLIDSPRAHFAGASGYADLDTQTPLQSDDAFQIGSITKIFTAVLVLQLVEQGMLALDDPLATWLPDTAAALPYGDQITLRHLLQHTSGIPDVEDDAELIALYLANPTEPVTAATIIDHVASLNKASFAPGQGWAYSSTGYLLLGQVIESVTESPYADVLRAHILDPLGMTHTYLADLEPAATEIVHGYAWHEDAWLDITNWNYAMAGAAGGLVSTPSELSVFIRALFRGDLLAEPTTLSEMLDTGASGDAGYGLGIRRMTSPDDPIVGWGHGGRTLGYQSRLIYIPGSIDIVLVMLTNNGEQFPAFDTIIEPAQTYWGVH
jgi:D-alanyl-D-alanine carboxypeptidase